LKQASFLEYKLSWLLKKFQDSSEFQVHYIPHIICRLRQIKILLGKRIAWQRAFMDKLMPALISE